MDTLWTLAALILAGGIGRLVLAWLTYRENRSQAQRFGMVAAELSNSAACFLTGTIVAVMKLSEDFSQAEISIALLIGLLLIAAISLSGDRLRELGERWYRSRAAGNPDYADDPVGNSLQTHAADRRGDAT